jgi:serine protease Do
LANNLDWLAALNEEQAGIVERVQKSLVHVRNGREGRQAGAGVIWQANGIVVTNAHVAPEHHQSLWIELWGGRTVEATIIAVDRANDIAALAADATDLDTIALGNSQALHPGQLVFALGYPWGVPRDVTAGVVIGAGAQLPESAPANREWVAVSLRLRPGNSGGPLVDVRGELLGLNTMMTGPDFGLAIPTHVVKKFMREVLAKVH